MIDKIFGSPKLPQCIKDCLLISEAGTIYIGTVYLFSASRKLSVWEVGEVWKRDSLTVNHSFIGYFSCPFNQRLMGINDEGTYTIQSNPNDNKTILRLKDVSFSRTNQQYGVSSFFQPSSHV
ncbi:hypothetical protein [Paenibacillus sp. sgz302251]|uniref:hypothetical protein n=1 Tax=Paenibacillus sp. sgz302251 TaxID=3414493 RepID=UPI003C7A25D7